MALVLATLGTPYACCRQIGPVVAHADLTVDGLIQELGTPSRREVAVLRDALGRQLIKSKDLVAEARQLAAETRVEVVTWEASCWRNDSDYFEGLFDPATGKVLERKAKGWPLTSGWTRLR